MKDIVVSGTRPTGILHLGNYYGAVRNYVRLQDEVSDCYFFIADYHALTTHNDPEGLNHLVKETVATYLAAGLDPEKVCIYIQSDIPQTAELYLLFNMIAYKGELEKVATFKEKIRKHESNVNAGLLTYPVLMAADILIHRATKVPVGKDQEQHLEMTRNFAKRFNHHFGREYFPEPVAYNFGQELIKVPGLDGAGKMSKSNSVNSAIFLNDPDELIRKKIMKAKTDSGPTEPGQEFSDEFSNLLALMDIVSESDVRDHFAKSYSEGQIRYGDMKKQLAEDMMNFIRPFRERIEDFMNDEVKLNQILKRGAEKAAISASETVGVAREMVGIRYY
jgi:tryptophanyl-tRNA synthetase